MAAANTSSNITHFSNVAVGVSGGSSTFTVNGVAATTGNVAVGDADTSILAANSGKTHVVANVTADRTFTLPAEADGLEFEFVADVAAADGHDWIFTTGSDTNYFTGGVLWGIPAGAIAVVGSDLNSNSIFTVTLPNAGTRVRFTCNGTTWNVNGTVISATTPAFTDQP